MSAAAFDGQTIRDKDGKVVSGKTNVSGSKSSVWLHEESRSGIPHLHVIVSRVDERGNINNDHAIHLRAQRAAEKVALQRGWTTAMHVHEDNIPKVSADCMEALRELSVWSWEGYRKRLAGYTSEQDIQELDGLTEKISGQINGLHNLLDEIKDLREEMHGIHESLRHTLQRERTAFNALTAAKDSAENIVDGISNAIVKAEQHTVIKAEVSTAELEKINQWSAAHIKAEEEIWTRQSKKLARYLSKNEGIWLSSRWLIFMIIVQAVSYFAVIFWAIFCNP